MGSNCLRDLIELKIFSGGMEVALPCQVRRWVQGYAWHNNYLAVPLAIAQAYNRGCSPSSAWVLWTLAFVLAVFFAGCFLGRRSAGASVGGTLCIAQEGGTAVQILHDSDRVAASSSVLSDLPRLPTSARKTIRDGGLASESGLGDRELRVSRFRGGRGSMA